MKRCPKCGFETADEEKNFCPHCSCEDGNSPVRLATEQVAKATVNIPSYEANKASLCNASMNSSATVRNTNVAKNEIHGGDIIDQGTASVVASVMNSAPSSDINGDANAVSVHGPISKDDHSSKKVKIINNITNTEPTEDERLRRIENAYYNECCRLIHDGFIDDDGQRQLNAMQISLGLNKDRADSIQKNVTSQSRRKRTGLNITVVNLISIAKRYIELNDKTRLQTIIKELEAYKGQYGDDNLDQIYYQLKAILSPDTYVKDFTTITTSYWETFWSYIPLIRIDIKKASESLAALERWGYYYPSQNQSLLQTIGLLMQNRLLEARETFKSIVPGYSEDLEPICFSIRELLDKHWDETTDVSPRAKFYVDALFKSAYTSISQEAKDRKADKIAAAHEAEIAAKAIRDKKDNFIIQYEEKKGSIYDALVLAGVTQLQFDEWKRYDANFRIAIDTIDKRLEENKRKEDAKIEERKASFLSYYQTNGLSINDTLMSFGVSQEEFSEWMSKDSSFLEKCKEIEEQQRIANEVLLSKIRSQKERFLNLYKSNKCDIQKTCSELELTPEIIDEWRKHDGAFDNRICYFKRELKNKRIRKSISTGLACILIIVLSVLIVTHICDTQQRKVQAEQRYNELLQQFNEKYANVRFDEDGAAVLEYFYNTFENIKIIKDSLNIPSDIQYTALKEKFCVKCDELMDYYISKSMPIEGSPDEIKIESQKYLGLVDKVNQIKLSVEDKHCISAIDLNDFYTAVAIFGRGDYAKALQLFESCKSKLNEKYVSNLDKWILQCKYNIDEQTKIEENAAERRRLRETNEYVYVSATPGTLNVSGQTFDISAAASTSLTSKQYKCVNDIGQSLYSVYLTANIGETRYVKEEDRTCSSITVMVQTKNSISGVILNTDNISIPLESADMVSVRKAYRKLQTEIENIISNGLKKQ